MNPAEEVIGNNDNGDKDDLFKTHTLYGITNTILYLLNYTGVILLISPYFPII